MKKSQEENDKAFAGHLPGLLEYHRNMLCDEARNRLLAQAIERSVTSKTSFLDIGAGSGVWAILAAKLGAKRVVAVEIEEPLIPIIYKHAQENGIADRIEIIHGDCSDVKLRGKFDCIVSELFGDNAFGPEVVKSFVDIRERFLAKGGTLIPEKISLLAVPVHIDAPSVPAGIDVKSEFLASLRLNYAQPKGLRERGNISFLADPKPLVELDFVNVTEAPPLNELTASWDFSDVSQANAIATINRSTFLPGLELDSLESQSWSLSLYEFAPFDVAEGTLALSIGLEAENVNWSVSVPSQPDVSARTYAPVFAFTRLRMAQQTTPHKAFKPKKKKSARSK